MVFEDLMHRVMAYEAHDMATEDLLANWVSQSRAVRNRQRTEFVEPQGWVLTSVEAHGEAFGRLIVVSRESVSTEQLLILERAATALTLRTRSAGTAE